MSFVCSLVFKETRFQWMTQILTHQLQDADTRRIPIVSEHRYNTNGRVFEQAASAWIYGIKTCRQHQYKKQCGKL